ncbi:hypothetical protein FRC06_007035 [Ceratobasidium sp. 370]|nr:hypothetical protein FRC06_007035 [Ceratobasidium sp. 370]
MPGAKANSAKVRKLAETADQLRKRFGMRCDQNPGVVSRDDIWPPRDAKDVEFRTERFDPDAFPTRSENYYRQDVFQRTANSFAFLQPGTDRMVIPTPVAVGTADTNRYDMVAFVSPLTDGTRRATRYLSGYTPFYAEHTHPDVWQASTVFLRDCVGTPRAGDAVFFGIRIPCVVARSIDGTCEYVLQNPDSEFKGLWQIAVADWAVLSAKGKTNALRAWHDPVIEDPRPWWANKWAFTMLRLEHGHPPDHPHDPPRRAMLGACRRDPDEDTRRAPMTHAEWERVPIEDCDSGDDEEGSSDAGSIINNPDCGVPTASDWDPRTRRSRSGPGPIAARGGARRQQGRGATRVGAAAPGGGQSVRSRRAATAVAPPAGPSMQTVPAAQPAAPEAPPVDNLGSDIDAHGEVDMDVDRPQASSAIVLPPTAQAPIALPALPPPPAPPLPPANPAPRAQPQAAPSSWSAILPPSRSSSTLDARQSHTVRQQCRLLRLRQATCRVPGVESSSRPPGAVVTPQPAPAGPSRPPLLAVPQPGAPTQRTGTRGGPSRARGREESREATEPPY